MEAHDSQLGIELDRTFLEIRDVAGEVDPEELVTAALALGKAMTWPEILESCYVVVLGEAGTGKTTEFRRRAALGSRHLSGFFVELTALATDGLQASLVLEDRGQLDDWRSADEDACFFLDSLDEAKLQRRTLREALLKLQRELEDQWGRVRLIISCRVSDWRETDRAAVEAVVPADRRDGIRVVQLAPLGAEQVARIAAHVGVCDVDRFSQAVADGYAQAFVERPLDVGWLGAYWTKHGRLGSFRDLIADNIDEKLIERSPSRFSDLSLEKKREGARALAGITALTRRLSIALPGDPIDVQRAESAIDTQEVFANWSRPEIEELLRTGLFDESTYGRVRFHHRSVQEFLTAKWLHELRRAELPLEKVRDLFLREEAGETAVPRHLGPVLAWLCLWDGELRAEMINETPALLIAHGDPSGFSGEERIEILRSFAACYGNRSKLFHNFEHASLERFSTPALAGAVGALLAQEDLPEEFVALLFEIVEFGRIEACLAEALRAALSREQPNGVRISAIRAVTALGGVEHRRQLLALLDSTQTWPQDVAGAYVKALYPDVLGVDGLLRVLERCELKRKNLMTLLQGVLEHDVPERGDPELRLQLLGCLLGFLRLEGADGAVSVVKDRDWMLQALGLLAGAVLDDLPKGAEHPEVVGRVLEFFRWCNAHGMRTQYGVDEVREAMARHPEVRRQLFWERVEDHRQETGRLPRSRLELRYRHDLFELSADDASWLAKDATSRSDVRERLLAFDALSFMPRTAEDNERYLDMLRDVARSVPALQKRFERSLMRTPVQRPEDEKWARTQRADELRVERRREEDRAALERERDSIGDGSNLNALWFLLRRAQEKQMPNRWGDASTDSLRELYGDTIADAAGQGWRAFWRTRNPTLPHERKRNTTPVDVMVGLVGLTMDFESGLDPNSLDASEVEKATRYAANELNGFPKWFETLAASQPEGVRIALQPVLEADYIAQEEVHGVLAKLPWAADSVKAACAPVVLELILRESPPTLKALKEGLASVISVNDLDLGGLDAVVGERCRSAQGDLPCFGVWWLAWACREGNGAVDLLEELVHDLPREQAYAIVLEVCHRIHDGIERVQVALCNELASLKRLVPIVYDFIAPTDDVDHEGVYTPGKRDNAQEVRTLLVKRIADIPGQDAVAALRDLAGDPRVAPIREWVLHQADARVVANADLNKPDVAGFLVTLYRVHGTAARDHVGFAQTGASIVKILFIASNPRVAQLDELEIDEEARDIEIKMRATDFRDAFLFKTRWAVRPLDLQQLLLEERPTVVHFSGHGAGSKGLIFHGEQSGEEQRISSETLRDVFRVHGKGVRVVVLNACDSEEQARLLSEIVDFVVGMRSGIDDDAARVFAAAFYRGLGFGCTVEEAFDQGVLELNLAGFKQDADVPELFARPGLPASETRLVTAGGSP